MLTAVIISGTGCSNEGTEIGGNTHNSSLSSEASDTSKNEEAEPDNINHDNPRVYYTKEEVSELINNIDSEMLNFTNTVNPDGLLYAFGGMDSLKVFLLFGITAAAFLAGYLIIRLNWRDQGA